jgi:HSP20 family protein
MPVQRPGFTLPLDELRHELDRFWTTLVTPPSPVAQDPRPFQGWATGRGTVPAVNVWETADGFVVEAEIPGVDVSQVDISVAGEELVLKGSRSTHDRHATAPESDCAAGGECRATPADPGQVHAGHPDAAGPDEEKVVWLLRERESGRFERRIPLPAVVDTSRVEARLNHGVLTITCPKLAACQPRKVEVRGA